MAPPAHGATCPAADLHEPVSGGRSVTCGVMANERDHLGSQVQRDSHRGVVVTERDDPATFRFFCCGDYTECPVWRDEKDRIAAKRKRAYADPVRPPLEAKNDVMVVGPEHADEREVREFVDGA